MMMAMMQDDDDDHDHVVGQDGLAMVQTGSWPLKHHHCVKGLQQFLILITEGKHPLAPLVSNAFLREIPFYEWYGWARPWQFVECVVAVVVATMEKKTMSMTMWAMMTMISDTIDYDWGDNDGDDMGDHDGDDTG